MHGHIPSLKAVFNASARRTGRVAHLDLARQKKLLAKGRKGVAFDPAAGMLTFAPRKKKDCAGFRI